MTFASECTACDQLLRYYYGMRVVGIERRIFVLFFASECSVCAVLFYQVVRDDLIEYLT